MNGKERERVRERVRRYRDRVQGSTWKHVEGVWVKESLAWGGKEEEDRSEKTSWRKKREGEEDCLEEWRR